MRVSARGRQNRAMFPRAAKKHVCRFALVFTVIASVYFSALAAPNYFTRSWQVEQGLPQNKVTAVVQTHDGYLWAGTYNGLARFDGVRFTVFDEKNTPELHNRRITSLFEADDGLLWIGTESGDVTQYKDGHFAAVPLRANWRGGKIYGITSDEVGDVWLMNEAGELARVRDGRVLTPPAGVIAKVVALTRSASGQIWVNREGRVSLLQQGQLQPVGFAATNSETYPYVQGICRESRWRALGGLQQRPAQMEGWRMGRQFGRRPVGLGRHRELRGNFRRRAGGRHVGRGAVAVLYWSRRTCRRCILIAQMDYLPTG